MESCVQSQGEEEEIELISLQPPQPQRPFSSFSLLLRSTQAFLLLVIILLLLILNSQGGKKKKSTVTTSLVRALPYQFRICSSRRRKWGERGLVLSACTHKHTHKLHLFTKEYCTVLHGYCNSRLEIEICRCTIISATDRDCLAMIQCKRIAGIFGANGGEECECYASSLLSPHLLLSSAS
jgi:hypothetical protein